MSTSENVVLCFILVCFSSLEVINLFDIFLNSASCLHHLNEPFFMQILTGHQDNAEFALAMCPTEPFVLSGGLCLCNL